MNCQQKKKNGEIEIFRLVFCLAVLFTHLGAFFGMGLFQRGAFAVEFFFLVSGYFMARTAERAEAVSFDDTISFLVRKVKSFLPYYVGAVIVHLIVFRIIICHTSLYNLLAGAAQLIPEALFLQMGGFATESIINIPAVWYLSTMLLSMLILYPFAVRFKKSYGIVFLILAIFGIGYLVRIHNGFIVVFRTKDCGLLYDGMLRGLCETALGAACYQMSKYISKTIVSSYKLFLTLIKYAGYIISVVYVFSGISNKYEPIVLIIMAGCLVLTASEVTYNIPYSKFTAFCGGFSLPLYLFHSVVLRCISSIRGTEKLSATETVFVVITILVMSFIFKCLCDIIMKLLKKKSDTDEVH